MRVSPSSPAACKSPLSQTSSSSSSSTEPPLRMQLVTRQMGRIETNFSTRLMAPTLTAHVWTPRPCAAGPTGITRMSAPRKDYASIRAAIFTGEKAVPIVPGRIPHVSSCLSTVPASMGQPRSVPVRRQKLCLLEEIDCVDSLPLEDGSIPNDVGVSPCDDGSWCYGANNRDCCSRHEGYFIVNGTQTKQNPNAATSSTSSSTASSSSSPTSTSSPAAPVPAPVPAPGALSTGAKAGIGVGIGLGALLLLAAVTWFLRRRRRGSHQSPDHKVVQPEGHKSHEPSLMAPKERTLSHPPELETPRIEERAEMNAGRASPPLPRELLG